MTTNEFNPFVGPRPFERIKEDSARFFGRTQETEEIVSLIFGHPVILVYAQSGAGKTSLFNASVAPALEENGFEVLPLTRVGGIVPRGISLKEIKNLYIFNALLKMDPEIDPQSLVSKSLPATLERRPRSTDENGQPRPRVIVFDQFEELFTYTPQQWREQREGFFHQVSDALEADPLLRVVFVIREDFLAELDPYARSLPERLRTRYRLERLGETAALRAVRDPLASTSRKFAPGVAEDLVQELLTMRTVDATGKTAEIKGQYVEPVQLQVVCVTLWSTLEPDVTEIQQVHLEDFDVNDALSNFYISAVESAAKETGVSETTLRNWFGRTLITPMGTRSTVFRGEERTGGVENSAVDFLESRHIIRAEFRAGARWYELTHDRLVEPILQNNQEWYKTHLSLFQRQAELWIQQGRSKGLLLSGEELEKAGEDAKKLTLTAEEKEFLEECREQQELTRNKLEQEARERRRLRQFLAIAGSLLVLAIIAAIFAFSQSTAATNSANEAATQRVFALNGQSTAESASTAAVDSANYASTQQAIAKEQQAIAEDQRNNAISGGLAAQADSLKNNDHDLALLLSVEAYQRTTPTILTRSTLFQLIQFTPYTRLFGFTNPVSSIVVSPDGSWFATANFNQITLIDSNTHQTLSTISGNGGSFGKVNSLALNKEGTLLAVGSCTPNGCSDNHGQITLWDVSDRSNPVKLSAFGSTKDTGHQNQVKAVAFSPNGDILASGGFDQRIILWDISKPESPEMIGTPLPNGHASFVNSLAFSPDGNILVSAGDDTKILLWDVSQPEATHRMKDPEEPHSAPVNAIAFSPDGTHFASASDDNTVILWDWSSGSLQKFKTLEGHTGYVRSLAFNSDGSRLASTGFDNTIILWDGKTGEQIGQPLSLHTRAINTVAFGETKKINGDNVSFLLSGSDDHTIIQWDLTTLQPLGQPIAKATPPTGLGTTARNGQMVATAEGQQIQLTGRMEPLVGHTGNVNWLSFSPQPIDGRTILVSVSDDQTVILWDVTDPANADVFLKLEGFGAPVASAFFTDDGKYLITIEENGHTTQWTIQPSDWLTLACDAVHRNLTQGAQGEWDKYLQGQPYHKTCPSYP